MDSKVKSARSVDELVIKRAVRLFIDRLKDQDEVTRARILEITCAVHTKTLQADIVANTVINLLTRPQVAESTKSSLVAYKRHVASKVRTLREHMELSVEELASLTGLHVNIISDIERTTGWPRIDDLIRIAGVLPLDIVELVSNVPQTA